MLCFRVSPIQEPCICALDRCTDRFPAVSSKKRRAVSKIRFAHAFHSFNDLVDTYVCGSRGRGFIPSQHDFSKKNNEARINHAGLVILDRFDSFVKLVTFVCLFFASLWTFQLATSWCRPGKAQKGMPHARHRFCKFFYRQRSARKPHLLRHRAFDEP